MRAPPPFDLTLHDAPAWRVVQALLWALAGGSLGAWGAARVEAMTGAGVGLAVAAAAAAAAGAMGWRLARPQQQRVRWSGQRWETLQQQHWQPATLQAMLDLGGWMLLRVRPVHGRSCWIGVSDAAMGPPGHLLRAALYCPASVDPGRADEDRARS